MAENNNNSVWERWALCVLLFLLGCIGELLWNWWNMWAFTSLTFYGNVQAVPFYYNIQAVDLLNHDKCVWSFVIWKVLSVTVYGIVNSAVNDESIFPAEFIIQC